jgi:hypothetical protein
MIANHEVEAIGTFRVRALLLMLAEAKPNMKQLPAMLSLSFLLLVGPFFGECCGVTSD